MTGDATHERVGFIGLGNIGKPMARRLTSWPGGLVVCDAVPSTTSSFRERGVMAVDTPAEMGSICRRVSVMVRDDNQVTEVIAGARGLLETMGPGSVIAVHSTIALETARAMADAAAQHGVVVLDAPVSGGAIGASQGTLAVMVGGEATACDDFRPVFGAWANLVEHFGPIGAGTQAKLARNLLHFTSFCAVNESLRLAESFGIDLKALGNVVRHSDSVTGGPGAIMLRDTTASMSADDPLRPIFEHTATLGTKDLSLALQLAAAQGLDLPLAAIAVGRLTSALGVGESQLPTPENEEQ